MHGWVNCERVWMPESGDYFCSKACLKVFNEKPAEVYDAIPNDSKPPDGPNVLKVRHRPEYAPETGMGHVVEHHDHGVRDRPAPLHQRALVQV